MEPKLDEGNKFKTSSKQHVLKKLLYDKDNKKSSSSSSSSSKQISSSEESKTSPDSTEKPPEENNIERPSSRSSPEPNCAICLEPLQNKSFTDSCFHTFCFSCLLEWSKVKAECPLCKQQFKSIVHNVQKDMTFDEYMIGSKTSKILTTYYRTEQQRFRYPTTMTTSRILERERSRLAYQSQIASHRMRFAPHSVILYSNAASIMSRLSCPFRRRVYEQNLWVKTPRVNNTRVATPEFYKRRPVNTQRLEPWLKRELISLWGDNEAQVNFVLELILSLVVRYHINSQEFLIHIEPYMGRHTHHFIHEFHAFAISPYDMENYDEHADYGIIPHSSDNSDHSSQDSDLIAIFTGENTSVPSQSRESYLSSANNTLIYSSSRSNPGPSTSGFRETNFLSGEGNTFSIRSTAIFPAVSGLEQSDEDEIQVVNVVKPCAERTPEIVDLSSDDEMPMTVIDVSSGEEIFSPVGSPSITSPPFATGSVNDDASSDIECLLKYQPTTIRDIPAANETSSEKDTKVDEELKESHHNSLATELESDDTTEVKKAPKLASAIVRPWNTGSESSYKSRTPQLKRHYSSSYLDDSLSESSDSERKISSRNLKLPNFVAREGSGNERKSITKKLKMQNFVASEGSDSERKSNSKKLKLPNVVANEGSDTERKSSSRRLKPHKFSSSDDSDSERKSGSRKLKLQKFSASEDSDSERKCSSRKLKLQSVIAHWSLGGHSNDRNRYDSSHRSSHKKCKEKKKKHKHTHRHKQRIYSDSDSA